MIKIKYSEIKSCVRPEPGLYEIITHKGEPLKVGISKNIAKRLLAHGASKQNSLKLKDEALGYCLSNVVSKQSILAKHLYFDSSVAQGYDLTIEQDRVRWLENECYITVKYTRSREEARKLEKIKEANGHYRYVGRVCLR